MMESVIRDSEYDHMHVLYDINSEDGTIAIVEPALLHPLACFLLQVTAGWKVSFCALSLFFIIRGLNFLQICHDCRGIRTVQRGNKGVG